MTPSADDRPRLRWLAWALAATATAAVAGAVVFSVAVGWSLSQALDAFVVTNGVMGFTFAVCGAIIASHRPRNPVGWLLATGGLAHAIAAVTAPALQLLFEASAPVVVLRLGVTVFFWSWPWNIGLCLPLALLLFPDGRPPTRQWRAVVIGVVVTFPLFLLASGASPQPPVEHMPGGYLTLASFDSLAPLWVAAEVRSLGAVILAVAGLVVRYRRGTEVERRQLLWLLLATIVVAAMTVPWSFVAGTPILILLAIPLIPISITVAIVRHRLLDIRLVVSRALAWALLSVGVVLGYAVLVTLLDRFVSAQLGRSAAATVIIALLVAPLLPRLQRVVDRAMYGDRRNPTRVMSRVAQKLVAGPSEGLPGVTAGIRDGLRLPYAAVSDLDGVLAAAGEEPLAGVESLALQYGGHRVGELIVGLRPGEKELSSADRDVLGLLTVPLAAALHAIGLSDELQASRERIVAAREEERRRLRRDLHDGLGPTLTGVALAADAAANFIQADPERSRELLASVRADSRSAIADVRRLVDDLRPPALDELGLVAALRRRADQTSLGADGGPLTIHVDAPTGVHDLPAAVEVAAYRIGTEALNNIVRHSGASRAVVTLRCGENLDLEIADNGPQNGAWTPGVGLQTMRERVDELGGRFSAGPSPQGGRVSVRLPLVRT